MRPKWPQAGSAYLGLRARARMCLLRVDDIYIGSISAAHLLTESVCLLQRRSSAVQRASSASSGDAAAAEDASPLDDGAASLYIRMIGECQSLDKHTHTHSLSLSRSLTLGAGGLASLAAGRRASATHPPARTHQWHWFLGIWSRAP